VADRAATSLAVVVERRTFAVDALAMISSAFTAIYVTSLGEVPWGGITSRRPNK
jgi:hypothetical protein